MEKMPTAQAALARVPEACRFLAVSRQTLYNLMNDRLPFVQFGRCRRIPWSALREFVEKHTVRS